MASVLMLGVLMPVTVQVRAFRDVTSRSLAAVCGINPWKDILDIRT